MSNWYYAIPAVIFLAVMLYNHYQSSHPTR